jgi:hypothetical protein
MEDHILLNIQCARKIPPVLKQQTVNTPLKLSRIDVTGDGNCGFYVVGVYNFLLHNTYLTLDDLRSLYSTVMLKKQERLAFCAEHYLEYIEVGVLLKEIAPEWNVAMIVQTNVKKTGQKRQKRTYPARVVSYKEENEKWVFVLMSQSANHYEILVNNGKVEFSKEDATALLESCETSYPEHEVNPEDQLGFLDEEEFVYI